MSKNGTYIKAIINIYIFYLVTMVPTCYVFLVLLVMYSTCMINKENVLAEKEQTNEDSKTLSENSH